MSVGYKILLRKRGFSTLIASLFLGAFNDNVFKITLSLVAVNLSGTSIDGGGSAGYVSLVGAVFILPFLIFSGYAGHAADVSSKRTVIVVMKFFEVAAAASALLALYYGDFNLMLATLFLLALQSAFLSPAKYGILPEMLPPEELSRANGMLEMATFLAIIIGTAAGSVIFAAWKGSLVLVGLFILLVAGVGAVLSLGVTKVPGSGAAKKLSLNPWSEIMKGVGSLLKDPVLGWTAAGVAWFWFLGALLQMTILLFGKEVMHLTDLRIGLLTTFLALGIGTGSLAAGRLSGSKIEPGLVPIGSAGIAAFSTLLYLSGASYGRAAVSITLLGFSGGLFIVPLKAILQRKSANVEKGRIIATSNFFNTIGILFASVVLWFLGDLLKISSSHVVLIIGLATIATTALAVWLLPDFLLRFVLWFITHTRYSIRILGGENVPARGPALLVANHVSFADPFFIGASIQRFIRFMVYKDFYEMRSIGWVMRLFKAIPVSDGNSREILQSISRAREELKAGHVVCIFPEGMISRTGNILEFKRGLERIVRGLDVPVIPVHLDGVWGSVFSFKGGRFFRKFPERLIRRITVSFGEPLPPGVTSEEARARVVALGAEAFGLRVKKGDTLHGGFIRAAKKNRHRFCMADSAGHALNYGRALARALLLSRRFKKLCAGEGAVTLMMPASVDGAIANISLLLAGNVPVNLNFSTDMGAVKFSLDQCGARTFITSRRFVEEAKLLGPMEEIREGMGIRVLFLEDIIESAGKAEKVAAVAATLLPAMIIKAVFSPGNRSTHDPAVIIFTSGSTTSPKGVILTHGNILSNIEGFRQVLHTAGHDRLLGALPFFHSFGFTMTIWFPVLSGFGAVYLTDPGDSKAVGELARKYEVTIIIGTPTFFSACTRKCLPGDFSTLRYAATGTEKLNGKVAKEFMERFGVELLEVYGLTEMSPVVSVNTYDVANGKVRQEGKRPGTVGRAIPGVAAMVVDPGSGDILPAGAEGLLLVKGPSLMAGYLDNGLAESEAVRDGWLVTGDMASISPDGFITITDRLSRFSKIDGEMVRHMKVEEKLTDALGGSGAVVVAVPDSSRGERLVAFYEKCEVEPSEVWKRLCSTRLPRLWIPKRDSIFVLDEIPRTATGKTDLKKLKALALSSLTQKKAEQGIKKGLQCKRPPRR